MPGCEGESFVEATPPGAPKRLGAVVVAGGENVAAISVRPVRPPAVSLPVGNVGSRDAEEAAAAGKPAVSAGPARAATPGERTSGDAAPRSGLPPVAGGMIAGAAGAAVAVVGTKGGGDPAPLGADAPNPFCIDVASVGAGVAAPPYGFGDMAIAGGFAVAAGPRENGSFDGGGLVMAVPEKGGGLADPAAGRMAEGGGK